MKPVTRPVKGHALVGEGAPHTEAGRLIDHSGWGGTGGRGYGRCQCGAQSDRPLDSGRDRKAWHRLHKATVARDAR